MIFLLYVCIFISVVAMPCMPCGMMRRTNKLKRKYFMENGGLLLMKQLAPSGSFVLKIFTTGELKKATNNFHEEVDGQCPI